MPPQVRVVATDEDVDQLPRPGDTGELWIGGPTVFREYWRRPQATLEAFGYQGYAHCLRGNSLFGLFISYFGLRLFWSGFVDGCFPAPIEVRSGLERIYVNSHSPQVFQDWGFCPDWHWDFDDFYSFGFRFVSPQFFYPLIAHFLFF